MFCTIIDGSTIVFSRLSSRYPLSYIYCISCHYFCQVSTLLSFLLIASLLSWMRFNNAKFGHMAMLFPAKQANWNFNLIFGLSHLSICCRRACIGHLIYLIWWQTANKGLFCWFSTKWIWLSYYTLSWIGWETQTGCSKRDVTNMVLEPWFCQPWVWEEVSFGYMPTVWQKDLMTKLWKLVKSTESFWTGWKLVRD